MMAPSRRPENLPDFSDPPVVEVVLSVQFASLTAFRTIHVGLLWQEFRDQFPEASEHPPLPPVFETFGLTPASGFVMPAPRLEFLQTPPISRQWFAKSDGSELIQFQPDRLVHNWKKRGPDHSYPRYEHIREQFEAEIFKVNSFLERHALGTVKPNQCEVTYVNAIQLRTDADHKARLSEIVTVWSDRTSDNFLGILEGADLQAHYLMRDDDGTPYCRLHMLAAPALRQDSAEPVVRMELTARGRPTADTIPAALDLLDREREVVVRGFASVTTSEMHARWGRKDAGA